MKMVDLRHNIENIVGYQLAENSIAWDEWKELTGDTKKTLGCCVEKNNRFLWAWSFSEEYVNVWEVEAARVSESEHKLIELLLQTAANQVRPISGGKGSEEAAIYQLSTWMQRQLKAEDLVEEIPNHLEIKPKLGLVSVPFLLQCETRAKPNIQYQKLNSLLKSYFGNELLLIPLEDQEWMILVAENELEDLRQESQEGREAERTMLVDLCQGVYELITNEWVGNFHITVSQPIVAEQSLLSTAQMLRETILIGRMFHISQHMHLPWELYLERLVYSIPDKQRKLFVERIGVGLALLSDQETLTTLETFFQLDCNVSETAKRLYIHRNTLLYRMDKIKQESGIDVRSFKDAVLMKLTLLLYKVTKRV